MATVVNQTRVGAPAKATGGIFIAPVGTPLPVDADTQLNEAFKISGLIGEEGLTESPNRETDDVKAWGGHLARVLQSDYAIEVTLTYIERTETTLKEVHGDDNVKVTPGSGKTTTEIRLVYPNSQVVNVGESQYNHTGLISYPVTLKCYPDENGNYGYEYETVATS